MALTRISIERAHRVWLETQVIDHGPRSGAKFRFKVIERLFVEDEFDAEDRLRRKKSVAFPVLMIEYDNESDFAKRAITHFQRAHRKGCSHLSWPSSSIG